MIRYFTIVVKNIPTKSFHSFEEDLVLQLTGHAGTVYVQNLIGYQGMIRGTYGIVKESPRDEYPQKVFSSHYFIPKNRDQFESVIKQIRTKFRYQHEWVSFRRDARRLTYTPVPKDWDETLPKKVAIWASTELKKLSRDESCVDNYRVARIGNSPQERRYRRQQRSGCCGFFDEVMICPHDGNAYRLGFNYGH